MYRLSNIEPTDRWCLREDVTVFELDESNADIANNLDRIGFRVLDAVTKLAVVLTINGNLFLK